LVIALSVIDYCNFITIIVLSMIGYWTLLESYCTFHDWLFPLSTALFLIGSVLFSICSEPS
jgi:hypothetical protein